MRIIYFSRDYTPHDHRFLTALAQTEHTVGYLRLEANNHTLEDRPVPDLIEILPWKGGRGVVDWRTGFQLISDLRRTIRVFQPDLIQAGPIQRSALLTALSGFCPLISMSWGYDLIYDARRSLLWNWATRYTLQRSAVLIGDCDTIRQLAISYGMPEERIVTFPWGIDLEHFSPESPAGAQQEQPVGENPPTFTLLSTRGWEPIYGVDVIARAFVLAAKQAPQLRLVMLGNGSLAAELHRTFESNGLHDRVTFPGQVSQLKLPDYYRLADLYISASHSDGTSISLLEAMACGKPVLVSDIPGNREWVRPGDNGWWFPDGDAGALAKSILDIVKMHDQLPVFGRAARRVAQERADWGHNFRKLLQAYQLALQPELSLQS